MSVNINNTALSVYSHMKQCITICDSNQFRPLNKLILINSGAPKSDRSIQPQPQQDDISLSVYRELQTKYYLSCMATAMFTVPETKATKVEIVKNTVWSPTMICHR